jgi:hypothetical protein
VASAGYVVVAIGALVTIAVLTDRIDPDTL